MNLQSVYEAISPFIDSPLDDAVSLREFLLTLIVTFLITIAFVLYVNRKIKQSNPEVPSKGLVLFFENYVNGFNNLIDSITGSRLRNAYSYFFTIFNFILVSNLISLLGLVPAATSIAFTFTLGMITFIGIYVIGICTNGFIHYFKEKYKNPIEILGQFSPLLSISIRLFGATLAGYIIGEIFVIIAGGIFVNNSEAAMLWTGFAISPVIWVWNLIDSALTIIQAFVFTVLTALYWSLDYGPSWNKKERAKHFNAEKELKKQLKQENRKTKNSG